MPSQGSFVGWRVHRGLGTFPRFDAKGSLPSNSQLATKLVGNSICLFALLVARQIHQYHKGEKGAFILSFCFRSNSSREDFGRMQNLSMLLRCLFALHTIPNSAGLRKKTSETPPAMGLMFPYLELLQPFIPFFIYMPFHRRTPTLTKHFSFNTYNLFAIFSPVWPISCTCQRSFPPNLSKRHAAITRAYWWFFFTLGRPIRV